MRAWPPHSPVLTSAEPVWMTLTATGSLNSVPRNTCGTNGRAAWGRSGKQSSRQVISCLSVDHWRRWYSGSQHAQLRKSELNCTRTVPKPPWPSTTGLPLGPLVREIALCRGNGRATDGRCNAMQRPGICCCLRLAGEGPKPPYPLLGYGQAAALMGFMYATGPA